jgi:hypothetical protein
VHGVVRRPLELIMAKKKPASVDGVVDVAGGPIRRTNRFFIALRSYGHCDENGKTVMGVECSAKKVPSPPDRPLALVAAILDDLLLVMSYSSKEAMEKDLREFQKYVADLRVS